MVPNHPRSCPGGGLPVGFRFRGLGFEAREEAASARAGRLFEDSLEHFAGFLEAQGLLALALYPHPRSVLV